MSDTNTDTAPQTDYTGLTAQIVSAFVGNSSNSISVDDVSKLIPNVHSALLGLDGEASAQAEPLEPAVPIKKSVQKDHIVCLEDGKKMKMLKRYLRTKYDMTPDEYRTKWGLPADYPMVAPDYSETRRGLAKKIGLGRKPGQKVKKTTGRKKKAA